ncbi:MAG: hypothetical protein IPL88_15955 [Rhizobiales bacterium]|nr:hypothetical protein [Hyphomicrobiales bacterium]
MALPLRLPAARPADARGRAVGLIFGAAAALALSGGPAAAQFFWDKPGPPAKAGAGKPQKPAKPAPQPSRPQVAPEEDAGGQSGGPSGGLVGEGGERGPRPPPVARPNARPEPIILLKSVVGGLDIIENSATLAQVAGLKGGKGSFLSLRTGPGSNLKEIERLNEGRLLIPIMQGDPEWYGVIVAPPGVDSAEAIAAACQFDAPAAAAMGEQTVYKGPCRAGWVARRWVKMVVD